MASPRLSSPRRWMRQRLIVVVSFLFFGYAAAVGGDKAAFRDPMMSTEAQHRQDMCDRFDNFLRTKDLRQGLSGMELNVAIGAYTGAFFNYDDETGINPDDPGMIAVILDELGKRAGFTWRNSFGVYKDPHLVNATWDELLLWSTNSYDISVDYWYHSLKRMNAGVAYIKDWYDASAILVGKAPEKGRVPINPWNWLRPYDVNVWLVTLFTILSSAVVYQILEWYADDRQDRSMWDWWQENAYMSFINFTQAYEYQPKSFASRIFGISMAVWALVMTATYTANLASLLVDRRDPVVPATSLQEIAHQKLRVCTWEGTTHDQYVHETFPDAIRVPKAIQLDMYQAVQNGECDFLVDSVAGWGKFKAMRDYNPTCDLFWVKEDVRITELYGAFATKADSGNLCSGFVRDVLNIHMEDMIQEGFLEDAWSKEYKSTETIDCDTYEYDGSSDHPEEDDGFRKLRASTQRQPPNSRYQRELKASSKGAAGGAVAGMVGDPESQRLSMESMFGIFIFHWGLMMLSLFVAVTNGYLESKQKQEGWPSIWFLSYSKRGEDDEDKKFSSEDNMTNTNSPSLYMSTRYEEDSVGEQYLRDQVASMQNKLEEFEKKVCRQQEEAQKQQQAFQQQLLQIIRNQCKAPPPCDTNDLNHRGPPSHVLNQSAPILYSMVNQGPCPPRYPGTFSEIESDSSVDRSPERLADVA